MQKSTTIIGVLEMLGDGFSYNDIRTRYAIGNSTITDINKKFKTMDVTLNVMLHAKCKNVANKMQKIGFKKRHFNWLLHAK